MIVEIDKRSYLALWVLLSPTRIRGHSRYIKHYDIWNIHNAHTVARDVIVSILIK